MRKAVAVVLLVAAALSLAGCESNAPIPTPAPAQIVGAWHHGSDVVKISADGNFTISGMPQGVIDQTAVPRGGSPAGPPKTVSGTWAIGTGGTDVGGAPGVQLTFKHPQKIGYSYGLTLIVSDASPLQLYVTLGRPDSDVHYTFTRR